MSTLRRTQMYFPDELLTALKKRADEEGQTIASLVRDAVSEFLKKRKAKNWEKDTLWNLVGSSHSKDGDLSVKHDRYLYGKEK